MLQEGAGVLSVDTHTKREQLRWEEATTHGKTEWKQFFAVCSCSNEGRGNPQGGFIWMKRDLGQGGAREVPGGGWGASEARL